VLSQIVYTFPDPDLLDSLISLYFSMSNQFWPLLHRPTFMKSISEGLHYTNPDFGKIVLLVCAVASQWSDDCRVLGPNGSFLWHLAGWKWYDQVRFEKRSSLASPTLYDLQTCFVRSILKIYLCSPHSLYDAAFCFILVGRPWSRIQLDNTWHWFTIGSRRRRSQA
jgi:hypothetical protein